MKNKKGSLKFSLRKGPFILIAGFITLMIIGIGLDEPLRVLEQAKSICLSCMGIG